MFGVGTRMVSIANRSIPVLLDITRLTSRAGQGAFTGVDRVEAAYLNWCLETAPSFFCVARIASGFVLLDRSGALEFRDRIDGKRSWGTRDLRAKVGIKTPKVRGQAESDLRRLSIAHFGKSNLGRISDHLPDERFVYLNAGHSNLSVGTFRALQSARCSLAVFVHDMIPLELPELQRPETVKKFENRMRAVARLSSLVITNSEDTRSRVAQQFDTWGDKPTTMVAHLGIESAKQDRPPPLLRRDRPYFVAIGTIEPRKNHRLLLDVWDLLSECPDVEKPELHIIGRRGWKNEDVFARLDALPENGPIYEHNNLPDRELWPMLAGARALLCPSIAEGFGLPTLEAAALDVPVVCGELAIHRELLGSYPVYADLNDPYSWLKTIVEMTKNRREQSGAEARPPIPTWEAHFERINQSLKKLV